MNAKKAFTLIELLVVIAIIAILAAILFPVFAQAKEAAKKTACLSNEKQLALGILMYNNDSDDTFNELASFLGSLKTSITEIDLLPYHTSAENKYKRFGKKNFMKHVKSASKETLLNRKCSLEKMGFKVKIGG